MKTKNKPFGGLAESPLSYLAVPYTYKHSDKRTQQLVQKFRFEAVTRAAGWLLSEHGWNVLSPITHSHPIHVLYPEVRGDWESWKRIDTEFLQLSSRIIVLTLPGWKDSTGVTAELEIAKGLGIDLWYIHPYFDGFTLAETPRENFRISVDLV